MPIGLAWYTLELTQAILSNICNCCRVGCASMKGIIARGHDKPSISSMFEAIIEEDKCTGCEIAWVVAPWVPSVSGIQPR